MPNLINRDFHADRPNEKWLTDIVPISDDRLLRRKTRMLDKALGQLHDGEKPIVHTDRGCHYRWPGWIKRMNDAEVKRSMSKKGCSPDNSACEGFFGIVKNELFYNLDLAGVTKNEFKKELNEYLEWFCKDRIKMSLGGMSPDDYRKSLNLI